MSTRDDNFTLQVIYPESPRLQDDYLAFFGKHDGSLEKAIRSVRDETTGGKIPEAHRKQREGRDGPNHHITLVHRNDLLSGTGVAGKAGHSAAAFGTVCEAFERYTAACTLPQELVLLGLASIPTQPDVILIPVVHLPTLFSRARLNLRTKNLHATVAFADADVVDDSLRDWKRITWRARHGEALCFLLQSCQDWLRAHSKGANEVERNIIAENIRDLCGLVLGDDGWMKDWRRCTSDASENGSEDKEDGSHGELLHLRSRMHGILGDHKAALKDALEAFNIDSESVAYTARLATVLLDVGDGERAKRYVSRALIRNPGNKLLGIVLSQAERNIGPQRP
ncbi:uncharacterized protein EV422DRAFT_210659 [Fimicolochytrium jonesii]|uniref:uncharacterized protein n=1 Tax=Fimicolochytrium jonesii TaxID=1396493 RepID=UPI0022FE5BE4|nr:uncharacterized protein EV422DRAFT_210659 [Fimicolochytrium jonesii]KAI8817653.1 hypothetical protein EV422DRAFT_210659 [Fimicolochytrium jonesii]